MEREGNRENVGAKDGRKERRGRSPRGSWFLSLLSSCPVFIVLVALLLVGRAALATPPEPLDYPWLYLRDGEPWADGEEAVEVIAVGDVMLGRAVADVHQPFAAMVPLLRTADLTMGNLECVITAAGQSPVAGETELLEPLRAPPLAVSRLRRAGFDVLGLANNHTLDLGPAGLAETAARLHADGIATVGAGPDTAGAFQAVVREVGEVRLAFLAFNAVPDGRSLQGGGWTWAGWDPKHVVAAINIARDQADVVLVSVHWGYEYEKRVDPAQREAAQMLFRAGADLVMGHHPHVVQPFEVDDGRCAAYSLGNFVFDQGQGETGQGLALPILVDRQGLRAVQALPVWAGKRPHLMRPQRAGELLRRVVPPLKVSFACAEEACQRVEASRYELAEAGSGPFWGGRIDLTGDGVAEHVRRIRQQVVVYSDGAEAWRSPPTWQVVDVALGDPNDDGRDEMLLAVWKTGLDGLETPSPEKERMPRSHPFIVGYRGGSYRILWGGSAVRHPIREVELGDVDGDKIQELVVLEGADSRNSTISVWHWHGWGFSLTWRSESGAYRHLSLGDDGVIHVVGE